MKLSESLVQSLENFDPKLLVLSGFHMMEGLQPESGLTRSEPALLVALLSQLSVPVHLELASMTDPEFMRSVSSPDDAHVDIVHVLGLPSGLWD
uniref:ADP-dependent glucokinase n=1 Tax=Neogobius melanostomus TaxID=47308 RepID=A0A8C6TU95_9GOBI